MDKITAAINGNPELDEPGIAVTCPFDGANFTLKAKKLVIGLTMTIVRLVFRLRSKTSTMKKFRKQFSKV